VTTVAGLVYHIISTQALWSETGLSGRDFLTMLLAATVSLEESLHKKLRGQRATTAFSPKGTTVLSTAALSKFQYHPSYSRSPCFRF